MNKILITYFYVHILNLNVFLLKIAYFLKILENDGRFKIANNV